MERNRQRFMADSKQFLTLQPPIPPELYPFMYEILENGCVKLNVHIAQINKPDQFGNVNTTGFADPLLHHVTAEVYTMNVKCLYHLLIQCMSGSALAWASNASVIPRNRGEVLYPLYVQRFRPNTVFQLHHAKECLLRIEFRNNLTGKSVIDHIHRLLQRLADASEDPSQPATVSWELVSRRIAEQLYKDEYFALSMRRLLTEFWDFEKLKQELTDLDYVNNALGKVDLQSNRRTGPTVQQLRSATHQQRSGRQRTRRQQSGSTKKYQARAVRAEHQQRQQSKRDRCRNTARRKASVCLLILLVVKLQVIKPKWLSITTMCYRLCYLTIRCLGRCWRCREVISKV